MAKRYAIYFAPDSVSPLWSFGSSVIGYDARTGRDVPFLVPAGFTPAEWQAATADPRKYGFHATLKAPFGLALGMSEGALLEAADRIAAKLAPVDLGRCDVGVIDSMEGGGFVAITPVSPPSALRRLERAVVEGFEPLRAPLDPADRARRRPERFTQRQRDFLDRYGYPYVLEEFGFHMTLSGRLEAPHPVAERLREEAGTRGIAREIAVDRLEVFRQAAEGSRFKVVSTHLLRAPVG